MRDDEEWQETMKNDEILTQNNEKQQRMTSTRALMIVLRLYNGTTIGQLQV